MHKMRFMYAVFESVSRCNVHVLSLVGRTGIISLNTECCNISGIPAENKQNRGSDVETGS